jgi:hypothetical protein
MLLFFDVRNVDCKRLGRLVGLFCNFVEEELKKWLAKRRKFDKTTTTTI